MRKLGAIFLVLLATSAWGGELIIVAPDFCCPYSCKASDANRGFTIDIIDAIFSAHGDRVKFVNMNYARALSEVRSDPELKLRKAGCEKASDTYMAISPKSLQAQRYAKIFSDGMKELKRSGELTRILERYGINKSEDN